MAPTSAAGAGLFVVSGCSGSGKSTLIAALAACGETVAAEPGRQIVQEQLRVGGDALPWANAQQFIALCAQRTLADFDRCAALGGRAFFDRSFIDVACAVERSGLPAPDGFAAALQSRRYAAQVFISAPWPALFHTDEERRHSFEEAVAEYEALVPAYRRHGYEIVFIPPAPVAERVAFVLSATTGFKSSRRRR